jgi:hypothetical protein
MSPDSKANIPEESYHGSAETLRILWGVLSVFSPDIEKFSTLIIPNT